MIPRGREVRALDVTVVGAGVAGLTSAVRLLEAGYRVRVIAAEEPGDTTSAVAGAVWYPYRADPRGRVLTWSARTAETLTRLAERGLGGVRLMPLVEVVPPGTPNPWFMGAVTAFRRAEPADLPPTAGDGWCFLTPVVAMPMYLGWLFGQVGALGGRFEHRRLAYLGEAAAGADVIVCCPGLGARTLLGDRAVVPVRGQVVLVANPGLERVLVAQTGRGDPTYVIPRGTDCVLGGTAEEDCWSVDPDPATATAIVERCAALEPRLLGTEVLGHKAGLRPARPSVRLETDHTNGKLVVHNYGHGGAGVTLSWGCAEEILALLAAA